jgi:hypothetical protein
MFGVVAGRIEGGREKIQRLFRGNCRAGLDKSRHEGQARIMDMQIQPRGPVPPQPEQVAFHRTELGVILGLYGRMVAAGEWRDYGISCLREVAVFSVFRRTAEHPIYRIEKRPKLRDRQGQYSVIGMDGRILKRGHDLKTVLRVLERKLIRVVE